MASLLQHLCLLLPFLPLSIFAQNNQNISQGSYFPAKHDTTSWVSSPSDISQNIWTSLLEPTDTILPTQVPALNDKLRSRLTDIDFSIGRFLFQLLGGSNLVLRTISLNSEYGYEYYYSSGTDGSGYQLVFNQSGYIYIKLRNQSSVSLTQQTNMVSYRGFYHWATLDSDVVFRQYIYPKEYPNNGGWKQAWSVMLSLPPDICNSGVVTIGSRICGFNSYCELDEDQRPVCKCPDEYSYLDQKYTIDGCKQDFAPQSCESGGLDAEKQFELKEMPNTNWLEGDYECLSPVNEDKCREQCINDCLCDVAIFGGTECWKKKIPLSNGRRGSEIGGKVLIKVAKSNRSLIPSPFPLDVTQRERDQLTKILIGSLLLGSSLFLNFLFLSAISVAVFFLYNRRALKHNPESSSFGMNLRSFTYKELEQVIDGFKNALGSGAFGIVYKGVLASDARNFVAVKKLNKVEKEGVEEFKTEVMAISQTHHRNLVHLIGFCDEGPHRLLVYEFMSNGSLASFIFGSPKPDWHQRKQIVLGIARGITLAKLLKADQTQTNTSIRGTKGYVAPEWFKKMAITAKVDVYSFGVMLLEIICCRKHLESVPENREVAILVEWAWDCYNERRLDLLVENGQDALSDARRLERFVMLAFWCIQDDPSLRPTMKTVTQMLEGATEVAVPSDPFLH
ncbi:G-type lectin S-receptor-like serine/threonine-protein kinase LECRK3 [Cinnamomum micranthum f. kanehirae]|uniref:non-specific serine/threonine protein kinase n=1 Tax=Cinnamomum micranthum f. kanehirae TaxID=337451 RepID=A0A443NH40_9MAGN|nr:G-type lectin S-receptor-like serine/threonine-protein kinase LECRK3 [Cinnamomum micranthum f. kanehirae]